MFRFSINGAFRYFHNYGVRVSRLQLKHTSSSLSESNPITRDSYWFIRSDSTTPSLQKEPSLPEIVSFDDFGVLSLDRSKSSETISTLGEASFIDNLLRNETFNVYDGFIPTTVDIKEMGGTGEVLEQIEIVLSEELNITDDENEFCSLAEIKSAIHLKDMPKLQHLLAKAWPSPRELAPFLNKLFGFIVINSPTTLEAVGYFQKLASQNKRAFIKDEIVLELALRAVHEDGVECGTKILQDVRQMFTTKAPMSSAGKVDRKLLSLYREAFERGSVQEVQKLHDVVSTRGYSSTSVGQLLRAAAESFKKEKFDLAFTNWSRLASCYGDATGSENILEIALCNPDEKESAKQIGTILKFTKLLKHPYSSLADLICMYVRKDEVEKAEDLMSKLSVSGKHFKVPLQQFSCETNGLKHIEQFAQLVSTCMYGEKNRGGVKKERKKDSNLNPELLRVIDSQCRTSFTRLPRQFEKFKYDKKKKPCRVDEEQLNSLSKCIQTTWLTLAESEKNYESAQRMVSWCLQHRVEISENLSKRVSQLK